MQSFIFNAMNRDLALEFGKRVRALRQSMGISQEDLAERASLHRTYIGMIERGEKNITLSNIEKVATALEVTISELFDSREINGI